MKISKDGIEIEHNKYLSDSSTGFFLYLNILFLVSYNLIDIPFLKKPIDTQALTIEVVILVTLFLLNTAIGLLVSILSWIFLEIANTYIFEWLFFHAKLPLWTVQFNKEFRKLCVSKGITYKNWYVNLVEYEEELTQKNVDIARFILQRSARVLIRNISFILLLDILFFTITKKYQLILPFSLCFLLISLIGGFFSFFLNVGLFFKYHVYKKLNP